jgi:hypothetical protein
MENLNIADSHLVTNEVQVNLHMLRPLMLNHIVAVDERALGERVVKLS